ncbi:MAG: AtpZ/AtpI family protein [candidate division KSB1 bacterium]
MGKEQAKGHVAALRNAAPYMDLGLRFALAAALGGWFGYWLDGKLHTQPLLLILGIMLGGTAGFINLYRTVMRLTESEARRKQQK